MASPVEYAAEEVEVSYDFYDYPKDPEDGRMLMERDPASTIFRPEDYIPNDQEELELHRPKVDPVADLDARPEEIKKTLCFWNGKENQREIGTKIFELIFEEDKQIKEMFSKIFDPEQDTTDCLQREKMIVHVTRFVQALQFAAKNVYCKSQIRGLACVFYHVGRYHCCEQLKNFESFGFLAFENAVKKVLREKNFEPIAVGSYEKLLAFMSKYLKYGYDTRTVATHGEDAVGGQ